LSAAGPYLTDYIDVSSLDPELLVVTSDAPNNHLVGIGMGYDGVVQIDIESGLSFCSGALLYGSQHSSGY
jgi:hypothetical protein